MLSEEIMELQIMELRHEPVLGNEAACREELNSLREAEEAQGCLGDQREGRSFKSRTWLLGKPPLFAPPPR
jgi:hypothetical protein